MRRNDWLPLGARFECQGSGKCCLSRGQVGYVYLTREDRGRMARFLGMSRRRFERSHCVRDDGYWRLKETRRDGECRFLDGKRCSVYEGRPTQCRTWPFWPELMRPRAWRREVVAFCPGVGKGGRVGARKMREALRAQTEADRLLDEEARNG